MTQLVIKGHTTAGIAAALHLSPLNRAGLPEDDLEKAGLSGWC